MSAAAFPQQWNRRFPGIEPVGYEMRNSGAGHWVRFHSLPESKRYADTDAEWRELLARQNELAAAVLGEDRACWLVQSCWERHPDDSAFRGVNDPFQAVADYGLEPALVTVREPDTEFEQRWEACVSLTTWSSGRFDQLLRQIADDEAAPTLWFSSDIGAVFAPYDGGVDLFLPNESAVTELTEQHPDWLSSYPTGL